MKTAVVAMLTKLLLILLRILPAKYSLKFLLHPDNILYELIFQEAIRYGKGVHPKHRLTDYHRFFIENVKEGEKVLDIGCGFGELTYDIAVKSKSALVVGIDMDGKAIERAKKLYEGKIGNLKFMLGKAPEDLPNEVFDVVVLSNVLEHQRDRITFLKEIIRRVKPKKILIRVPCFERDWRVPLKKELDVKYFTDPTHHTEYTIEEFIREITLAGLKIEKLTIKWGEIWTVCRVEKHEHVFDSF